MVAMFEVLRLSEWIGWGLKDFGFQIVEVSKRRNCVWMSEMGSRIVAKIGFW
jgi:hypothetical protein